MEYNRARQHWYIKGKKKIPDAPDHLRRYLMAGDAIYALAEELEQDPDAVDAWMKLYMPQGQEV